ncbi:MULTISPECIES: hypothetical protein [Aeromonas]|uniref:hypothetical protein n=1 Tax=Aeromonas TaxID=642 RepID=UPI000DCF65A5|nr:MULTISPECIES: hypothetical protein [Aeromonas]MBS4701699.1 hypothetical protein [Aeromonas media]MCE9926272.1 hypothetical protein [Aeromonas media]QIY88331.1 hypothetical protein HFP99_17865 [Aeromonas hydrophila]
MEMHQAYRERMSAQLKEWGCQINLLEARLETLSADMRVKGSKELQALRARQHAASDSMEVLGRESGESWEQVKLTADQMWHDLKSGLAEAQSKFK